MIESNNYYFSIVSQVQYDVDFYVDIAWLSYRT